MFGINFQKNRLPKVNDPMFFGWHIIEYHDKKLRPILAHGDGRIIRVGKTLAIPKRKEIALCNTGLHACYLLSQLPSYSTFYSLHFLSFVVVWGNLQTNLIRNKFCGRYRRVLNLWRIRDFDSLPTCAYDCVNGTVKMEQGWVSLGVLKERLYPITSEKREAFLFSVGAKKEEMVNFNTGWKR